MRKRLFSLCGLLLILLYWSSGYIFVERYLDNSNFTQLKLKTILFWNPKFRQKDWWLGLGAGPFRHCSYNNCLFTVDRTLLPVEKFDAILFHTAQFCGGIPEKRHPDQVYVFGIAEPPIYTTDCIDRLSFNNFYNWTLTYRQNSDIFMPYGRIVEEETEYKLPSVGDIKGKSRTAAWIVSNCSPHSRRQDLYKALSKLMEIDVYGKCGTYECSIKESEKCYDMLEKTYKFYLSFENSLCEDYVTEKLFDILRKNIIPIVYGAANYSLIAPQNSVINVQDFETVEDLVDYLKYLDRNPEEYSKFFRWKQHYSIVDYRKKLVCDLCEKLNRPIEKKIYGNIGQWWRGKNYDKCYRPESKHHLSKLLKIFE